MRLIPDQRVITPTDVASLQVPGVVAAWAKDPVLHPIKVARRIAELLPKGEFVEMARPADLTPAAAAALMSDWVNGLIARS
jgi:hypothetical protein